MNAEQFNKMETIGVARGEGGEFIYRKSDGNAYVEIEGLVNNAEYAIYTGKIQELSGDWYA